MGDVRHVYFPGGGRNEVVHEYPPVPVFFGWDSEVNTAYLYQRKTFTARGTMRAGDLAYVGNGVAVSIPGLTMGTCSRPRCICCADVNDGDRVDIEFRWYHGF